MIFPSYVVIFGIILWKNIFHVTYIVKKYYMYEFSFQVRSNMVKIDWLKSFKRKDLHAMFCAVEDHGWVQRLVEWDSRVRGAKVGGAA